MNVYDLLAKSPGLKSDNPAVSHGDSRLSYTQLQSGSGAIARRLEKLSLPKGSRVAILLENSVEYVMAFFAVFKAGYVVVPVDTSLNTASLKYVLTDCDAQVLLAGFKFRRILPELMEGETPVRLVISDRAVNIKREDIPVELFRDIINDPNDKDSNPTDDLSSDEAGADELAAIFYTSGSTGKPKGVMLSHRNLVSNTTATIEYLKLKQSDSIIVILPFYYIYGNSLLLTHVACGGRLVIDNRFLYPEVVLDTMEEESVTGFSGVPSNFMILLGNSTFARRRLETLRYFTQAGGAMAPDVIRQLMAAFPTKEIYIMYGQTEAAPRVTYLPPGKLKEKLGSIGIPIPGVQVDVVDESGEALPPGQTGEIMVTGPNVMLGYWNQSEEEREVLRDGRLFTGDLARKDEDGYIFVVGRKKEIIKTGGNRVSVKEIEECIVAHEKVLEVAVFGVEDPVLGEAIKAIIVTKPETEMDTKEVTDHCRTCLATHKIPRHVQFADSLPKQKSGKIDKVRLKRESNNTP